jgi:uncharacterized protein (DUF3084 family)
MPSSSNITSFRFEALIHNPDDTLVTSGNFCVQFYNTLSDTWEMIVEPAPPQIGAFDEVLDTSAPDAAVAEASGTFLSAVQAGGMPSVRLVRDTTTALPEVVSEGAKLRKGATSAEGSVDFGDVWIIEANQYERVGDGTQTELDDKVIAIHRPKNNNKLFKGLKAAIMQADIFDSFTQEQIDDFFAKIVDGSLIKMEAQIAALEAEVGTLEADVATHVSAIADRDAMIATQVTDIAAKDATIATQVTDIADRDATIAVQVTDIAAKDATIATQVTDIADRDATIATQVTDIATKDATITTQVTEIADKYAAIAVQGTDLAERDASIVTYTADIVDKDATIAVQVGDISEKSATIEAHAAKIIEQETAMAEAAVVYEASKAELGGVKGDLVVCEATVLEKEAEAHAQDCVIAEKEAGILAKTAEVTERDTIILLKDAELVEKDAELVVRAAAIADLSADIDGKDATIVGLEADKGDLQAQVDSLVGPALPVKEVYTNIVTELQAAANELDLSSNRYSLANLSLDLKTTVLQSPEGELLLQLVDNDSAKKVIGEAVSSLTFDVGEGGGTTAVGPNIAPQVTGLTETAVRFKLNSLGLKLEAIYHPVDEDDARVVGHSFKQTPAPGEDISAEGTITVIFAKKQDRQN